MKLRFGASLFFSSVLLCVAVAQNPSEIGEWNGPYPTPLIPVAAANLPDGRVVYWSAYDKFRFGGSRGETATAIFDPVTKTSTENFVQHTDHDMFCPGTAALEDGRIMITGGSNAEAVTMYDPATNQWTKEPPMIVPRGYHSMTVLHDGSVFTVGGSWSGGIGGKYGEIWDPTLNKWNPLTNITTPPMQTDDVRGVFCSDNHIPLHNCAVLLVKSRRLFRQDKDKCQRAKCQKDLLWLKA